MRSVEDWLGEYSESHRHGINKMLHWVCVPLIVLSVIGLIWSLPVPHAFASASPWLNWATLAAAAALIYYFSLSPLLSVGALLSFVGLFAIVIALDQLPWPLWLSSAVIFAAAWVGQFIGHAIEGRRPSFLKDAQFLLIGPMWLLASLYRRMGVHY